LEILTDQVPATPRGDVSPIGRRFSFMNHPNLNWDIDFPTPRPQGEEGFYLDDLAYGAVMEIDTQHHHYRLVKHADTHVRISGHPRFCPQPIEVELEGSFKCGPPLEPHPGFIGRGMYMVFKHPLFNQVTTSRIREIHKLD
jgi:hypothetical protein